MTPCPITPEQWADIAQHISDEVANRVRQWHRMRESGRYHDIGDHVLDRLVDAGVFEVSTQSNAKGRHEHPANTTR